MSSTVSNSNFFHLKRVMPMAASARFGAFRNLFGHFHHHSRRHEHNNHGHIGARERATSGGYLASLRHASAMSNAILRNLSSSTAMGEPSHLVDPSSSSSGGDDSNDDFDERHRRYSFITVMAITGLFVLITVSIVALILGLCRKNSSAIFSLGESRSRRRSGRGGARGGRSRHDGNRSRSGKTNNNGQNSKNVSHFELDSLDAELDKDDLETKTCKDDPRGVCYYHLSDDDDDDEDGEDEDNEPDDDTYNSDEDYFEIDDRRNADDLEKNTPSSQVKKKKQRGKEKKRKGKLRFRDSRYYYHLHNDADDDNCEDYSLHQITVGHDDRVHGHHSGMSLTFPKRSTTFPQLGSVLISCIKGDSVSLYQQSEPRCQKSSNTLTSPQLSSSSLPQSIHSSTIAPNYEHCVARTPSNADQSSSTSPTLTFRDYKHSSSDNAKPISRGSQYQLGIADPQIVVSNVKSHRKLINDSPKPLALQTTNTNSTSSKLNAKKRTVSTVPHHFRQHNFLPSKRRRRMFKSYSLHDIPHHRVNRIPKSWYPPTQRPITYGVLNAQGALSHQVTFKVGTSLGETDIRLHHV